MGAKRSTGVGLHVEGAEKFRADLNKANSAIKQTNAEVKKLDATYGKGSTGSDYLIQRTKALTTQLDNQRKKTAALKGELELYQSSGKTTTAQLEKYRMEILKSETAEAQLTREIRDANDALSAQKLTAEKVASTLDGYAKKAGKVGDSLTRALTLPIAGMGTYALNAAMELEDAMKTVQTLPGVTSGSVAEQAAQMEAYTDAIIDASNATHTAAEELALAQYQAISAGTAAEDSVYLVERSAKAAKSGLSDVETVVDGTTSILNAWKDAAGGADHVLDAMMVAQNEGKTTIGDLASNIGQVTGLAPQLGVALDEVLAATAALTKGGVQTSSAINGLKAVFSNVLKPTAEAREEAERLGLQFDAAALQSRGFTGFLGSIMDATNGDSESLAKLFGSVEGLSQIMALGTTQADEYARILNEIGNSAGAVDEAFAVRTASKAEQLKGSLNELRNSGIELAENLYPAVDAVTELIGGTAGVIGQMDDGTQKALVSILGVAAAIGPTTKAVAGLTSTVAKLIPLLSGPWGLAAAGAVAVGGIVITLANAETSAERLDNTLKSMELTPDDSKLAGLTAKIQAAIDGVNGEKLVNVTAKVQSDFTGVQAEYDSISKALQAEMDAAMEDYRVTWNEYSAITGMLNGAVLGDAREAQSSGDGVRSAVATEMIAAIDEANALLRAVYTSGDSVTAEELNQLEILLGQIMEYRAQLTGAHDQVMSVSEQISAEISAAIDDRKLEQAEYEAIKNRLDEEVRPDAVAAMEDTMTATIGAELEATLADFEALLAAVNARGGELTETEIGQIGMYLDRIANLQARIVDLQGLGSAVEKALEDSRLELEEYEAIKRRIDEETRPDAVVAMEDAATASIGAELDSTLTEFEALLDAINERGGDMTEEEIARINQYLTEIEGLNARIDELQGLNAAINTVLAEDPAYQVTVQGYGTDDTFAEAAGTVEGLRRWQQEELATRERAAYDQYLAAQSGAGTDVEREKNLEAYNTQMAALAAEAEAVDANAQQNYNALFAGWLKSKPEYAEFSKDLERYMGYVDLISAIWASDSPEADYRMMYDAGVLNWKDPVLKRSYAQQYGLVDDQGMALSYEDFADSAGKRSLSVNVVNAIVNDLWKKVEDYARTFDGSVDNPLTAMYQAMLDSGIDLENLDVTQAEGALADLMRLKLLKEDGFAALGSEAMEEIGSATVESSPVVIKDAEMVAEDIKEAVTKILDGAGIGMLTVLDLAAGIAGGTPSAVAAAESLAAQVSAALGGMRTFAPAAVLPAGASGLAGAANYDFSTNVNFGVGNFTSQSDVAQLSERLNTLNRLKHAGVGNLTRL